MKYLVPGLHGELIVLDTPEHPDSVAYIEKSEYDKLNKALNRIGILCMGELAYTKEFTEKVESICREALQVEKRWPY